MITKHIGCVKDILDETKQDHSSTERIGPRTALEAYILSGQGITGIKFTETTLQALGMGTNKILGFTTPNVKLNARDKHGLPLTKITKKETQLLTVLFLGSFMFSQALHMIGIRGKPILRLWDLEEILEVPKTQCPHL